MLSANKKFSVGGIDVGVGVAVGVDVGVVSGVGSEVGSGLVVCIGPLLGDGVGCSVGVWFGNGSPWVSIFPVLISRRGEGASSGAGLSSCRTEKWGSL